MTAFEPAVPQPQPSAIASVLSRSAPAVYATTLFVSALLLFAIQPMFTKMVLPLVGGAPSVWSVAMVFFQAALLIGYAYAHVLTRALSPARAAIVHFGLLAAAAAVLPIAIVQSFGAAPASGVELWIVALFAVSIGLPFVALAASAPLLQSWFAASGHPQAGNPYVLYAASNLGSFSALLAYPFVLEPLMTLRGQSALWSAGYAVLALLVAVTGLVVARARTARPAPADDAASAPTLLDRAAWTGLAAVPAGLVIAVTAHVATDLAAAPFLWVIPLALYLLTFVAVFRDRPWIPHQKIVFFAPFLIAPFTMIAVGSAQPNWMAAIAFNIVGFLVLTMLCHGELYRRRPAAARLTEFYLWVSFGGLLGGLFAGLLAPHIFTGTAEYPILIGLAVMALPGTFAGGPRAFLRQAGPVLAIVAAIVIHDAIAGTRLPLEAKLPLVIALAVVVGFMLLQRHQPARFFALAALTLVVSYLAYPGYGLVAQVRTFFGVHRVVDSADGTYRVLFHGTTIHGAAHVRLADGTPLTGRPELVMYYYPGGPFDDAVVAVRGVRGKLDRVAVAGLGTGSQACLRGAREEWTFFEIDPEVVRIAKDPSLFRFLSECAPDIAIVLGDARLTLAASPKKYDLIILDVFSSNAIPVHLLTHEAFAGYLSRLTPGGAIAIHLSNRHLELRAVVAGLAAAHGLVGTIKRDGSANFEATYRSNAEVAVLARRIEDLGDLPGRKGWQPLGMQADVPIWTDDYANILGAVWRKRFEN